MRSALGGFVLLLFVQDKDTLGKALKGTDDFKNYTYTITVKNLTSKKDEQRGGEFIWPKIITLRRGITEIAKRGDKAMVNEGKGYKPLDDVRNPSNKDLVAKLEAPHRGIMDVVESMEKIQKEKKDEEFDKVKCRIYHSSLTKDGLSKFAKRIIRSESSVDWTGSSGAVRIYVGKDDGRVHKVLFAYTFKTVGRPPFQPAQSLQYEEHVEFYEIDKTKLNLPDNVREALEIVD